MPDTDMPDELDEFVAEEMHNPEFALAYLGVRCDNELYCDTTITGDIKVRSDDPPAARLGYALDHAARNGWRIEGREDPITAKAFCPRHA